MTSVKLMVKQHVQSESKKNPNDLFRKYYSLSGVQKQLCKSSESACTINIVNIVQF